MATFEAQVEGLTSLSIDGSSAPTQTELTQFLTDGAKEIINVLPENLLNLCTSSVSFTSGSASTLNTGKISNVMRSDGDISQPCRDVPAIYKGRYSDPDDMNYATITDPIYYIENNSLDVLPAGGSVTYSEVQYPTVSYSDSAIAVFPDEAEYLVPLYASIKSLQNVLGNKSSNSDITTALTAINTEMDETQAVCDKIDADLVLAKAEVVLAKTEAAELATQTDNGGDFETACDAMATELAKVDNIIVEASTEFDKVDNVIVEGSVEFDKSSALLDLGETDSEGAVNTAAAKIITEMDETQAVCDKIDADLVLAKAEIVLAKAEAAELATQTDNSSDVATALTAINTELDKVDEVILLAHEEFDEVAAEVSSTVTSPITASRSAAPSVLSINDLTVSVSAPSAPSLATIEYPEASNADASASSIGAITVAAVSKADISGDVPTYTKPSLTSRVSFNTFFEGGSSNPLDDSDPGVFSTSTPPTLGTASFSTPGISTVTVASFGTAPAYTAPKVGGATEELTTTITDGTIGSDSDFQDYTDWWEVLGHLIEDEEDTELAGLQINKINSYLGAYQQALQNQLNVFNDANVEYQAAIQEKIKNADLAYQESQQEAQLLLQKEYQEYQSKVSEYQAEVNKDVQVYSQKLERYKAELNTVYQAWAKTESDSFQQYQLDIQNELNEFNKDNARYQANVQAELAKHNSDLQKVLNQARLDAEDAQKEAQLTTDVDKFNKAQDQALALTNAAKEMEDIVLNNKSLMEKFTGELNKYTAQVNDEVQEYQANLRQKVEEFDSSIKLQGTYFKEAEARVNAGDAFLKQAQATIAQAQGYANEVSARANFSGAKSQAIQGYISTAQSYIASAQGFGNEVQAKIAIAGGYIAEIDARLRQAESKRQESQSRLAAGGAYLQEAQAIIAQGSAYISEAQGYVSQAQGYATEVNARAGFSSAKAQSIQGYVNTAQSYVATAQGFANEIQAKINIAQGYSNEVQARLAVDTSHYGWYEKQQAKLQADYDKGLQLLISQGAQNVS
tara:strand:+ start:779 stop:3856 length:3078 start_codon:yes stop_codon:yes gene_type:complete